MKKLLLVLFTHIVATQALFAQLEIETTVPTGFDEAINVGVGTGYFETIIKNKSGVETITGIKVTPLGGLDGLEILANATYEYNGTVYSASVTGDVIKTVGSLRLMAGEQIKFIYEKRAKCSIVPQASSGYSMQVIDDISVLGTDYSEQTNSYPVLFPGLSVIVPESPLNNKDVMVQEDFTDSIIIRNEANSGKVQTMEIVMEWEYPFALDIQHVMLNEILFEVSKSNKQIKVSLDRQDLISLGFSDGIFHSDSQIKMTVEGNVSSYFSTMQVSYIVNYLINNQTCRQNENAKGIMYYHQIQPNPQMEMDLNIVQKGDLCGREAIFDVICKNLASNMPINSILDGYIKITGSNIIINKVEANGQVIEKTSRGYEFPGNEEPTHSELSGGSEVTLRVYATIRNNTSYSRTMMYCYFYGKDISGKELSMFVHTNDQIYDALSSIEGPGTLDIRTRPEGTYTYSCGAKRIPADDPMLLDYDVWVYVGDVPLKKLTFDQYGKANDSFPTVLQACQFEKIQFDMVVKSEGCSNKQVITSANANVVQRCWNGDEGYSDLYLSEEGGEDPNGTGEGGNGTEGDHDPSSSQGGAEKICADMYIDTTILEKGQIALCEILNVNSKAVVKYNCTDSECKPPKEVVVEIFDHNKQIKDFMVYDIIINNKRGSFVNYVQDYSRFYKCDYQNKCNQGQDEIIDTIKIQAQIEMPKTHFESTTRKDANIQVSIGYTDKNKLRISKYSWGEELSIFDAPPVFSSTVDLGHRGTCDVYVSVPQTEYENVSGIIVNKVEFPAFEDSYYTNPSESNMPLVKTTNDHINQGQENRYYTQIYPKCATDKYHPSPKGVKVWYTDFADNEMCRKDTVKIENVSFYDMEYLSPAIRLYATERQQAVTSETTWTIRVANEGSSLAEQVMLKFTINPENTMALYLEEFMMGANIIDDYQEFGGSFYVPVGRLNKGEEKNLKISVSYEECSAEGISTINVESAWSCEGLSPQNFDKFNCGGSSVLELENMVAVLSAVETYPNEYFKFCEDIPIHLTIDNIGRANLNKMGFGFESLPDVYSITDDIIIGSYEGETTEIANISSTPTSNTILSQNLLKLNNEAFKANSSMNIDFNIQMHCGSDMDIQREYQIPPIKFVVNGHTNCQTKQEKLFSYKPSLKGFERLDSIMVMAEATGFSEYKGLSEVLVSITNTTDVLIDSAYISVLLPKGFQYIGYVSMNDSIITGITQTPLSDGTILLQWELEQGRHMAAHETVSVTLKIRAIDDCANSATLLAMCTLKRQMVDCDGNICKVAQSTEAQRIMLVPIKKDNVPVLSGQESVCAGNPVEYMIEGTGIQNVTWQFSDENTNINSSSENSVQVIFPQANTITLSASIDGDCEDYKLTKTITVSDVPNIQLPDTIRVKWNALNALLDSLYTIGQWDSPFVINECGNYNKMVSKENQCGLANKNVVLRVTDCCDTVTVGDIVETELQGITTYDAFLLRYYLKHRGALQPTSDETFQLHLRDNICEEKIVPLRECFEKRADINNDGIIDELDIEQLQELIK